MMETNCMIMLRTSLTFICLLLLSCCGISHLSASALNYGVDVSWPMHYQNVSNNYLWFPHNVDPINNPVPDQYKNMVVQPLGNIQERYNNYIDGCVQYYDNTSLQQERLQTKDNKSNANIKKKGYRCIETEKDRYEMSLRQPQSVWNYTKYGYAKIRAPDKVFSLLKEFWDNNYNNQSKEQWDAGYTYTNHWEVESTLLNVANKDLIGGGLSLKTHIWNAARDTLEEWTGYRQAECSLYGIRVYKSGAMLAPHVDRLPLVASAIINVAQDVDEPWPLEVIGHDGLAHNVTMLPGDMVLYESHSIIHGRQFPLKGRFMANVFIHFEPIGPIGGQIEYTGDLPPYLLPGSLEEPYWRTKNPNGHKYMNAKFTTGSTELHEMASKGDVQQIQRILQSHDHLINVRDKNGWTPLHEAVRYGDVTALQLLLDKGADINARVYPNGDGGSVLWLAKSTLANSEADEYNNEIIDILIRNGAIDIPPVEKEL